LVEEINEARRKDAKLVAKENSRLQEEIEKLKSEYSLILVAEREALIRLVRKEVERNIE